MQAVDMASLLCSRLCHDLISPVGSFYNGLELLADENDPEMRAQCMELLTDSARKTSSRLRFYRLAFGTASGLGDTIDPAEVHGALQGHFDKHSRINLHWLNGGEPMSRTAVKLLLNLAMIGGDALLRGGDLYVGAEKSGFGVEIVVRAEGPRLLIDEDVRKALQGDQVNGDAATRAAAAIFAHLLASEAGGQIQISPPDDAMLLLGAILPTLA